MDLHVSFARRGVPMQPLASGGQVPLRFSTPDAEYQATRQRAGLFDFSFMGAWDFHGAAAGEALGRLQSRDPLRLAPGRIVYTLLLDDAGRVFIDATVWRLGPQHWRLFTGRPSDTAHIQARVQQSGAAVQERCGRDAVLALQGPRSAAILAALLGPALLRELPYFGFAETRFEGLRLLLGRIGYSGELGYELVLEQAGATRLWQVLLERGQAHGLLECGFESADMLRIECGHILFTRELANPVSPAALGLQRLVEAAHCARTGLPGGLAAGKPPASRLAGLVFPEDGAAKGRRGWLARISSECYSPSLGRRVALAWLPVRAQPGDEAHCEDGRPARVSALPLLASTRVRPRAQPELGLPE